MMSRAWGLRQMSSLVVLCPLAFLVASGASADGAEGNFVCDQPYVLCTSAPCIPDPTRPSDRSICQCAVQVGKSYGNTPCEARKPKTLADGTRALISTYSFEQAPMMRIMRCPAGNPWSNCLDQPCTVDPIDSKRAICTCKIVREGTFVTYGGSCDTGSCSLGYWSGATVASYEQGSAYFAKELGVERWPMNYCPDK